MGIRNKQCCSKCKVMQVVIEIALVKICKCPGNNNLSPEPIKRQATSTNGGAAGDKNSQEKPI